MNLTHAAHAAVLALVATTATAQTSTFVNNGGVHEAQEYGSNSFQLPLTSVLDKYTFALGAAVGALESDVAFVGRPVLTGTVTLWSDAAVDTVVGAYDFSAGTHSFGALLAGDYFYTVEATGAAGGGYTLGSYIVPVPEPGTYALLLAGLGVVAFVARRRKNG